MLKQRSQNTKTPFASQNPNFCRFVSEPTNNIPPKLTGERTLGKISTYSQHTSAVLLCPVVGYPYPISK